MNTALFINGNMENFPPTFQKIEEAQRNIKDALRMLETSVGEIKISEETCQIKLVVNMGLLKECHQRITENIDKIKEYYEQLVDKGIFEKEDRMNRPMLLNDRELPLMPK